MHGNFRIIFIGDIVGRPGRRMVKDYIRAVTKRHDALFVVANGENAAQGFGITRTVADELFSYGVDVITLGNHTWDKREAETFLDDERFLVRPANFSPYAPGRGFTVTEKKGVKLAVINLIGRVFMDNYESPFFTAERLLDDLRRVTPNVFVDFHAEATSEKKALAVFLDGRVTAVVGTHTHVQTADECVLRNGTAFITDVGMTGAHDSIIGNRHEDVLDRFLKGVPRKLEVATEDARLSYVVIDVGRDGRSTGITRYNEGENDAAAG